jgi:hypothetical protein
MYNTNINYSKCLIAICCISLITINTAIADKKEIYSKEATDYLHSVDLSTLDYHDINAILKQGNSREKQLIIKYLINERYNPHKLDLLISYYIHNDRNDLAKHWIKWGEENDVKIKPWQKLHLAIIQRDEESVKRIIENNKNKLPESMINDAFLAINKDKKILSNVKNEIYANSSSQRNTVQNDEVDLISISSSNSIITTFFSENYGVLEIDSSNITGEIKSDEYVISVTGKKNILNTDNSDTISKENIEDEVDLSINATKYFNRNVFSIGFGNNDRVTDDLTYAHLKYEYQHNEEIHGVFSIDYNKITYTSPVLRALGYQNKALFGLIFNPTPEYVINFNLSLHEYKTRKSDTIGKGYSINTSLNNILSFTPSYWDVSIRASVEENNLKSSIPSYITTTKIEQSDDIIEDYYSFLGLGTVYKYGFLDNSRYLTNNISINIYTGIIFPGESINYGLDIKYGYAFTPYSLLGLEAVYSNAFNSIEGNDYTKLTLYYKYHF